MSNRRDFLVTTAAAAGALLLEGARAGSDLPMAATGARRVRVLIFGGTGYIGPHFVRAAVERGHQVSVFTRGKTQADLPPNVERLFGDRDSDLDSIKNRDWDIVFDLAVYGPNWVRTVGRALAGRIKHYTFISTAAVYQLPGPIDETSAVQEYTGAGDPYTGAPADDQYGPLKLLCEREAERQFPGKVLILRPGDIVGPGDNIGVFTYWPVRQRGGELLVAGDPLARVQLIDVRDLADWAIAMAERAESGVFNAIGPALPIGWGEMLGAMRAPMTAPMKLTWVPTQWVLKQKVAPASNLLY